MTYTTVTPFRRPMTAALLQHGRMTERTEVPDGVNKWEALRELGVARDRFGVTDRALAVLQVLISFHKDTVLGDAEAGLIVYPSNAAICERLNGMPCSTMRRHLACLVTAGIVIRRDSPNGKRFSRRYADVKEAYGFDLAPLAIRFGEFCRAAEEVRAESERLARLRRTVSLMRRDLAALAEYGASLTPSEGFWDAMGDLARLAARDLRRKLDTSELEALSNSLQTALDRARNRLDTGFMSTNDAHNEQHIQTSKKDSHVLEPCPEKARSEPEPVDRDQPDEDGDAREAPYPSLPLVLILKACVQIQTYADRPIRHWHEFVAAADRVRPMMGISPSAWEEAMRIMGPEQAAIVVASMLERFEDIRSPGGYLRYLSAKAELGEFSCGPMVMALLNREAA